VNAHSRIEAIVNIATTAVAVLLSLVLVKTYLLPVSSPTKPPAPAAELKTGMSLEGKLAGVDWGRNGRTLVLAISTICHFCKDSEPFYRRLNRETGRAVKILAVVPQPATEAEQYLKAEGVGVDQVQQVRLSTIGVRGTPTIFLVDRKGVVTRIWTGKLQDKDEEQVLTLLKEG
jgi:hypothetical protein